MGCDANIEFSPSFGEKSWAKSIVESFASEAWCFRLEIFDARVVEGLLFIFKRLRGDLGIREERASREARQARVAPRLASVPQ